MHLHKFIKVISVFGKYVVRIGTKNKPLFTTKLQKKFTINISKNFRSHFKWLGSHLKKISQSLTKFTGNLLQNWFFYFTCSDNRSADSKLICQGQKYSPSSSPQRSSNCYLNYQLRSTIHSIVYWINMDLLSKMYSIERHYYNVLILTIIVVYTIYYIQRK